MAFSVSRMAVSGLLALALASLPGLAQADGWQPQVTVKEWRQLMPADITAGLTVRFSQSLSVRIVNLAPLKSNGFAQRHGDSCHLDDGRPALVVGTFRDRRQAIALMRVSGRALSGLGCADGALFFIPVREIEARLRSQAIRRAIELKELRRVRQLLQASGQGDGQGTPPARRLGK